MVQIKLLIVLLILTLVASKRQTNYCARKLCHGKPHIACHNSGQFAKICQNNGTNVVMKTQLRKVIVDKHNYYRDLIASGLLQKFEPAAQMLLLQWNDELAYFAKLNVLQCRMKHDECRNTARYKYCGQNLGLQSSAKEIDVDKTVADLITAWFSESTKASMNDVKTYRGYNYRSIGHFTGMIQEKASEIGCAIAKYRLNDMNHLLLACDYNYMNRIDKPVYRSGSNRSKCAKRKCKSKFKYLCCPQN